MGLVFWARVTEVCAGDWCCRGGDYRKGLVLVRGECDVGQRRNWDYWGRWLKGEDELTITIGGWKLIQEICQRTCPWG